jgi:hypothetical protein
MSAVFPVSSGGCYETAADGRLPMREGPLRDHRGAVIGLYVSLHRMPAVDQKRLLDGARRRRERLPLGRRLPW